MGYAGDPGNLVIESSTRSDPGPMVLDDDMSTSNPESVIMISFLARVWGPAQRVVEGHRRFEALWKAKKPRVSAAIMGGPF